MKRCWTFKYVALALAVSLSGGTAHSQEQTAENAQKFVAQIAGLGQMAYAYRHDRDTFEQTFYQDASVDYRGDEPPKRYFNKIIAPIWDVTSSNRCLTTFKYKSTNADWVETRYLIRTRDAERSMAWRSVAAVQQVGQQVHVRTATAYGNQYDRFDLPSQDMAKRMAYAMEFLRVSCDATQGTGF